MTRRIEMDHKARIAWVKSGNHAIASFDFDHWGGANKAQMAAEDYIQTRHENPWEMTERIEALEAENARLREELAHTEKTLKTTTILAAHE